MANQGNEYQLVGCYRDNSKGDLGLLLGPNRTTPETIGVSLTSCLKACATARPAAAAAPSFYVGVVGGNSCFCGDQLDDSTATAVDPALCITPCEGNATEACGGTNAMSVYKLAIPDDVSTLELSQATVASDQNKTNEMIEPPDSPTSPGVAAGIAMGTIIGVAMLLALVLFGIKRRKQHNPPSDTKPDVSAQPDIPFPRPPPHLRSRTASDMDTISVFSNVTDLTNEMGRITSISSPAFNTRSTRSEDKFTIGDATMVDLKRLSGIVVDGGSTPRKGIYAQPDGRTGTSGRPISYIDGNIRQIDVVAASSTTGAQWRHTQNLPLTPRTPRHRSDSDGDDGGFEMPRNNEPTSPLIRVQEPANVAQNNGLGDRAWHRRRLSMPFLPTGGSTRSMEETGASSPSNNPSRYSSPNWRPATGVSSKYEPSGRSSPNWRPATGVSSKYEPSGRSSPNWRPATGVSGSIVESPEGHEFIEDMGLSDGPPTPRALRVDVVSQIYDDDDDDDDKADDDEDHDRPALSPSWFWTVSNMARLSETGSDKTSKVD